MFSLIKDLPDFAIGITMAGKVTKKDFDRVLIPALEKVSKEWKGINLLLVHETGLTGFTAGAWLKDISVKLSYFSKWNKVAMVREEDVMASTLKILDIVIPGEIKIFDFTELKEAKAWICEP